MSEDDGKDVEQMTVAAIMILIAVAIIAIVKVMS